MTHTPSEVRRFDLFKLIVTLALLAFLITLLALRACQRTSTLLPTHGIEATRPNIEVEEIAEEEIVAPTLNLPAADGELTGGELTLTGTGAPGSKVQVLVDGEVVGVAQVGSDGTWSFTTELDDPGEHEIIVQALDAGGEVVAASEPALLTVAAAMAAPTLDFPAEGAELPSGELTLTGAGEPGTEVEIMDNGAVIGVAQIDEDGQWRFTLKPEVGDHQFAVRPTGEEAAVSGIVSAIVTSPVATTACASPAGMCTGDTYVVVAGDTLGCISKCAGVSLQALISANPRIKDPNLIFPGQVINIPR